MSGHEQIMQRVWADRVRLARPKADEAGVRHAVASIMRTPDGAYAREIKEAADRAEKAFWTPVASPEAPREGEANG